MGFIIKSNLKQTGVFLKIKDYALLLLIKRLSVLHHVLKIHYEYNYYK